MAKLLAPRLSPPQLLALCPMVSPRSRLPQLVFHCARFLRFLMVSSGVHNDFPIFPQANSYLHIHLLLRPSTSRHHSLCFHHQRRTCLDPRARLAILRRPDPGHTRRLGAHCDQRRCHRHRPRRQRLVCCGSHRDRPQRHCCHRLWLHPRHLQGHHWLQLRHFIRRRIRYLCALYCWCSRPQDAQRGCLDGRPRRCRRTVLNASLVVCVLPNCLR